MIWESHYWKQDLLKIADRMKQRMVQKHWPERSLINLEKDTFLAFYSVRKLIEAQKLSKSVVTSKINVSIFPTTGKGVTHLNRHRIDEHYDFSRKIEKQISLVFLCNQIIHSYIFTGLFDEDEGLAGILFSSDRERNRRVFQLNANDMIKVLSDVGSDYPTHLMAVFDKDMEDYRVELSSDSLLDKFPMTSKE